MKYGNYSEDEIIKNLNRNKTRIKKIKKKKDNEEIKKENQPDLDDNGMISTTNPITGESDTKIKTKKRKFGDNISLTFSQSMNKENILSTYNSMMKDYIEVGNPMPFTDKEKELFIKKIIPAVKLIDEPKSDAYNEFIEVFSSQLSIDKKDFSILIEYELFKSKIEGTFSTFSKLLNQFVLCLSDNSINDFTNINPIIDGSPEIKNKFDSIIYRIVSFKKLYNDYFKDKGAKLAEIITIIEKFIPGVKERNDEYISKISIKLKELFDKYKIKFSYQSFIDYIKEKFDQLDKDEEVIDINSLGNYYTIDKFFKLPIKEENDTKSKDGNTSLIAKKKKSKEKKEQSKEKENKIQNDNPVKKSKKKKSDKLIDDSITGYVVQTLPLLSHRYYVCSYDPSHFEEL